MIPVDVKPDQYDQSIAVAMARASLDAYLGPEHTERLGREWQADSVRLIVVGDVEALLLTSWNCTIIAFRGTSSHLDVKTDISATAAKWKGACVHAGFLKAWQSIRPTVVAALQGKLLDGQPLYVTGHSLGGALATLCAADFGSGRYAGRTSLYTFGSPRVGDRRFARMCDRFLSGSNWRFIHSNDAVPRIPRLFRKSFFLPEWLPLIPTTKRYHHVGDLVFLTEDGHQLTRPTWLRVLFERVIGFRFDIGRDHSMLNYMEAVA